MVAMSGGVDSAVAAALLKEQGYEVQGVTMRLWREPIAQQSSVPDGLADAGAVCVHLDIPHHIVDVRRLFLECVVDYFVQEYARGHTPNPCLRCNRDIKFGLLLDYVQVQSCDYLATGHYARNEQHAGMYRLFCAQDTCKDQSYVLYALQQRQLARVLFPLGMLTKVQVRALAEQWGLPVASRPESQDVCFLRDNDYRRFLRERLPEGCTPGPIYDTEGRLRGRHKGLPFYTVGQREGLGIAAEQPLYVLALDTTRNALLVGIAGELGRNVLWAEEMSYISGEAPAPGAQVEARIRYRARRVPAHVWSTPGGQARIVLEYPLRDITPGQAVVLYSSDQVLGGGTIVRSAVTEPDSAAGR
jgi:tRNA-uridine 2-sulfurtransferase